MKVSTDKGLRIVQSSRSQQKETPSPQGKEALKVLPLVHASQICQQKTLFLSYISGERKDGELESSGCVPADENSCILFPHPSHGSVGLQMLAHGELRPERVLLRAVPQPALPRGGSGLAALQQHLHETHTSTATGCCFGGNNEPFGKGVMFSPAPRGGNVVLMEKEAQHRSKSSPATTASAHLNPGWRLCKTKWCLLPPHRG